MVENIKLGQIIAKIDFLRIFQHKEHFRGNVTSSCQGDDFVGVTSTFTKSLSWFPCQPGHIVT